MSSDYRNKLEENDLTILHAYFESDNYSTVEMQEISYPFSSSTAFADLYSEVIENVEKRNVSRYLELLGKVKNSRLPADAKQWLATLLVVQKDAPIEELSSYSSGSKAMPEVPGEDSLLAASRIYANIQLQKTQNKLEKQRREERAREKELQQEIYERECIRKEAEENYQKHITGRG